MDKRGGGGGGIMIGVDMIVVDVVLEILSGCS